MVENKLLILGSLAFDYIMSFKEKFVNAVLIDHEKEEYQSTITADSRRQYFGGTAGNIAYNLGLLRTPNVLLLGSVGKDFESLGYLEHINQFKNIEVGVDFHEKLFTAACYIVNDVKSNQMIIFHGGALDECKNIDLRVKIKNPDDFLFAINSTQSVEAMTNFAEQLHYLKIPTIFDPGQVTPLFSKELLLRVLNMSKILIGNSFEISQIIQKTGLTEEKLIEIVDAIIRTNGSNGSELVYKDERSKILKFNIPIAKPEKIEDTTGAGDGYRAGLLTGLKLGMTLLDSCRLGSIIGSFVIESNGAQTQIFSLESVKKRFYNSLEYTPKELEKL